LIGSLCNARTGVDPPLLPLLAVMARPWRLFLWALAAAGLAALLVLGLGGSASTGRLAPALPREVLAGPPLTLAGPAGATGGRAALVTFWASWCGPCALEAPALERFSKSPSGQGRLIGVDWSDGLTQARSFIRRYSWTFSNVRDANGAVGNAYRITGLPTTFVLDRSGRIRAVLRGPQDVGSLERALASAGRS
jgi:cytochrome c biogenesis protein CcmG, thiol:disulfide interchange protein DsbE